MGVSTSCKRASTPTPAPLELVDHVTNKDDSDDDDSQYPNVLSGSNESFYRAIAITKEPVDVDKIDDTPPPAYRLGVALFCMVTYCGAYVLDVLLLKQYISRSDWVFFWITLAFILIPSIIIQLLSCKFFHDDDGHLKPWSIVMHVFLLGPLERYWNIIKYGRKARNNTNDKTNKKLYLENWRDSSMLRFLYAFLETGPQVTIQLYVLLDFQFGVSVGSLKEEHAVTMLKILATVGSLSFSMVTYNDDLRMSEGDELSIPGFVVQIVYRLLIIASRILTLVLFTMAFRFYVLIILILHWIIMVIWVHLDDTKFFIVGKFNECFEIIFQILMGFIYMFCYITTVPGPTLVKQTIYYLLFYFENVIMLVLWIWFNDRDLDSFEVSAITIILLTMILGIVFLVLYYKFFHPNKKREGFDRAASARGERGTGATMKLVFDRNAFM